MDPKFNKVLHNGYSILSRSVFLYVLVGLVLFKSVNWQALELNRMHYLYGIFLNGNLENYKDGVLYFERKVKQEPNNASAYAGLGVCYYNLKDYDQAIAAYQRAIALDDQTILRNQLELIENEKNGKGDPSTPAVLQFKTGP